jgi:hypothetical protein
MPESESTDSPAHSSGTPPNAEDPRWQLVERILATPDFKRAQKASEFLRTICRLTIEGRPDVINEQYLGSVLFGRSLDYDSSADTIVRTHALRLRQRLEQYFLHEGRAEELRLVIPRGAYIPQFLPISIPPAEASHETQSQKADLPSAEPAGERPATLQPPAAAQNGVASASKLRIYQISLCLSLAAAVVLGVALIVVLHHQQTTDAAKSRNHPLWGQIFTSDRRTQIVPGDAGLASFHEETHQSVSMLQYSNPGLVPVSHADHMDAEFARTFLRSGYVNFWDVLSVVSLTQLPEVKPTLLRVTNAYNIHTVDFQHDNVILIGNQQINPLVESFEKNMDFVFATGKSGHFDVVLNKHPRAGEPASYVPEASYASYTEYSNSPSAKEYAVIAFLPSLEGDNRVLLFEGATRLGTNTAVNVATHDDLLLPFLQKIQRPDGSIPYFEMLISYPADGNGARPTLVALHDYSVFP